MSLPQLSPRCRAPMSNAKLTMLSKRPAYLLGLFCSSVRNTNSGRPKRAFYFVHRNVHSFIPKPTKEDFSKYFQTLCISEESDQAEAREAFLKLAKKYHPDGGLPTSDSIKFQMVEVAYRKVLEKFSEERHNKDCEGEFGLYYEQKRSTHYDEEDENPDKIYDIEHTAPQHRQYLSYEGIGAGTPTQRQKQFTNFRAMRAAENVIDYKIQQLSVESEQTALVTKEKNAAKNIRTRYGIDRLVEDKIQDSIARGDFDNLPNAGKPLKYQNHNPFVDTVTHKLNQVLIDNGYAPEWVMLEKEIRQDKTSIINKLENYRQKLGSYPVTLKEEVIWKKLLSSLSAEVDELNKKIDKYNLVVPVMSKQVVHFPLEMLGAKMLKEGKAKQEAALEEKAKNPEADIVVTSNSATNEFGLKTILGLFKGG